MKDLLYLRNTLSNLGDWFDGFVAHMLDYADNLCSNETRQLIFLYDNHIKEILEHACNLVKDIEEGDINET